MDVQLHLINTRFLGFLLMVTTCLQMACSTVDDITPTTNINLRTLTIKQKGDSTSFSLAPIVTVGKSYTVAFKGLKRGRVILSSRGDSLFYIPNFPDLNIGDTGTYIVCLGTVCDTATAYFIRP